MHKKYCNIVFAAMIGELLEESLRIITELENIAAQVRGRISRGSRPFFIEFSGTPKAGKTTGTESLSLFLRRNNYKLNVLTERASTCPIKKKDHMFFNIWTSCSTLIGMLENLDYPNGNDIVIIDRGIFDALCWMEMLQTSGNLTDDERKIINKFLLLDRWKNLIDLVFLMTTTPEEAIKREYKELLTRKPGSIMNPQILTNFNLAIEKTYETMGQKFKKIIRMDTTEISAIQGVEKLTRATLNTMDEFVKETILTVNKKHLRKFNFSDGLIQETKHVSAIIDIIDEHGEAVERSVAEQSFDMIQVIPCGIFIYDNQIMLLRRKEKERGNGLHDKYLIWAGGHLRNTDMESSDPIIKCLERELDEEFNLKTEMRFSRIGVVVDESSMSSSLHMGIVHLITIENPNVAIAMDNKEFKETKGKSVSGKFFPLEEIVNYIDGMEFWSQSILKDYYNIDYSPDLSQKILF